MDFYSDTSKGTFHLVKQATTAVDLEKVASVVEGSTEGLPAGSFGDPKARAYPVHTPEDSILSAAYAAFDKNAAALEAIFAMGKVWGNEDVLRKIAEEVQGHEVSTKYALDLSISGKHYELFPYTGASDIKQASESFYENRHKLPWAAREKTASVLFAEILGYGGASETKVSREAFEYITKAAGFGLPDLDAADATLCARWYKDEKNPAYAKVAKILRVVHEDPTWDKIAMEAFDALDEETGAKVKYGKSLRLPEEDIYVNSVLTMKTASEAGIVKLSNGKVILLSDVDWAKVAQVDPLLYKEAAGGEKAAEVLPTWPRCDADILVEMLGLPLVEA